MKVLFLDMDGVLCTTRAHVAYSTQLLMRHLDPVSTRLVARLLKETGTLVVLSSTWRLHFDLSAMNTILMNGGFDDVPWHKNWRTPTAPRLSMHWTRGQEIGAWLGDNSPIERFVILDDDDDMLPDHMPFFVHTDTHEGFGFKDYEKALKILGGEP